MPNLKPPPPEPENVALFLDIDGTLLDFEKHPEQVRADDTLNALLERLSARLDGALALISGRSIGEIDRVFAPLKLAAAGTHGLEYRAEGDREVTKRAVEPLPAEALDEMQVFVAGRPGLLLEQKPLGAALHYRNAPEEADAVREHARSIAQRYGPGLRVLDGKMVCELVPGGHGKGTAIRAFMAGTPFRDRKPAFLGDDVTDEAGFRVVNEMDGLSVKIGDGEDTEARWRLPDVAAARAWLEGLLTA